MKRETLVSVPTDGAPMAVERGEDLLFITVGDGVAVVNASTAIALGDIITRWRHAQLAKDALASPTTAPDAPAPASDPAASPDGVLRLAMRVEHVAQGDTETSATIGLAGERVQANGSRKGAGVLRMQLTNLSTPEARQLGALFGRTGAVIIAVSIDPTKANGK